MVDNKPFDRAMSEFEFENSDVEWSNGFYTIGSLGLQLLRY